MRRRRRLRLRAALRYAAAAAPYHHKDAPPGDGKSIILWYRSGEDGLGSDLWNVVMWLQFDDRLLVSWHYRTSQPSETWSPLVSRQGLRIDVTDFAHAITTQTRMYRTRRRKAQLEPGEAQAHLAKDEGDYSVLVADFDGTVGETLAEPRQMVAAGQNVIKVAHAGPREAAISLPETIRPALGSVVRATIYDKTDSVDAHLRLCPRSSPG